MPNAPKQYTEAPPTAPMASGNVSPIATEADLQAARPKPRGDEKVGNFTHGGSDTRDGGRPPQGSDTKDIYRLIHSKR